jgi:hypothetical protein
LQQPNSAAELMASLNTPEEEKQEMYKTAEEKQIIEAT